MATFGKTAIGGSNHGWAVNYLFGSRYKVLSGDGTVTKISWYTTSVSKAKAAIYAVNGSNDPDALLASSGEITTASGWNDFALSLAITNNTWYYLAILQEGACWFKYDAGIEHHINSQLYAIGFPNPFGSEGSNNYDMSIYATYTPTATSSVNVSQFKRRWHRRRRVRTPVELFIYEHRAELMLLIQYLKAKLARLVNHSNK